MALTIANSAQISARYLRVLRRNPYYLMITLTQPLIWMLLFAQLFSRVVQIPGFSSNSYIGFLTPGVVAMGALFSSGWSGTSLITDMDRGVMDRQLVTPVARGALLNGLLAYQAVLTLIQSLIMLGLGAALGARYPGGAVAVLVFLACVLLLTTAFASLSNALALLLRKQDSVIATNVLLVLPLTFLSSALMPSTLVPGWIAGVARVNPVNWAVTVGRQMLATHVDWTQLGSNAGSLAVLAIAAAWWSVRAFRAYQRSV